MKHGGALVLLPVSGPVAHPHDFLEPPLKELDVKELAPVVLTHAGGVPQAPLLLTPSANPRARTLSVAQAGSPLAVRRVSYMLYSSWAHAVVAAIHASLLLLAIASWVL